MSKLPLFSFSFLLLFILHFPLYLPLFPPFISLTPLSIHLHHAPRPDPPTRSRSSLPPRRWSARRAPASRAGAPLAHEAPARRVGIPPAPTAGSSAASPPRSGAPRPPPCLSRVFLQRAHPRARRSRTEPRFCGSALPEQLQSPGFPGLGAGATHGAPHLNLFGRAPL
jgi:hypothetical protein